MDKCPICKEPLSMEMLPVGTEPGDTKKKLKAGYILPQVINYALDQALRTEIASGRSLYLTCNNAECPCCWKPSNPKYFKKGALTPSLVGDSTGVQLTFLQGQYRKKKKKKGLFGR
ncbi:MAG: hypothetical protein J6K39_04385 [Clostridia bacterium]|nr:hypothetical protein [Clostridia bacterium]